MEIIHCACALTIHYVQCPYSTCNLLIGFIERYLSSWMPRIVLGMIGDVRSATLAFSLFNLEQIVHMEN